MKKFMKAIAFATVMCLVLSTAAFAAVEATGKAVEVTVEDVQQGEQVAIIITEDGADFTKENILFVDQKAAGASTAVFNTTLDTDVETVDVYAGFASNSEGSAVLVAENVSIAEEVVNTITVTLKDVQIENNITETEANEELGYVGHVADEGTKGAVVYFKLNVADATEDDEIAGMFWAFEVKNDETQATATKYFAADATIVAALGSVLTGDVEIAAALNSTGYTVTDAFAVVVVNGEGEEVKLAE